MALTLNGRRTGRAGAEELAELRAMIDEAGIMNSKLDFGDLLRELRTLDPWGWSAWYDQAVPNFTWENPQPAMEVIRERIEELAVHDTSIASKPEAVTTS